MRIGILTYHSSHNYGAFLQAYALCESLNNEKDIDAEIIDYSTRSSQKENLRNVRYNDKNIRVLLYNIFRFFTFIRSSHKYHRLSSNRLVTDNLDKFSLWVKRQSYDAIIVGSDEIWKIDGYRGFPNAYWLPGVTGCIKISYAVSSRTDMQMISEEEHNNIRDLLESFSYLGVRDRITQRLIERDSVNDIVVHLNSDPTLSYDFAIEKVNAKEYVNRKYGTRKKIGVMVGVPEIAYRIIDELKDRYTIVSLYNYYEGTKGFRPVNPFEWIKIIAGLDGVITSFFHGMLFAVKYNTPFLLIENRQIPQKEYSKGYDFLERYSLQDKIIMMEEGEDCIIKKVKGFAECLGKQEADYSSVCEEERKLYDDFVFEMKKMFSNEL